MYNIVRLSGARQGEELFELEFENGNKEVVNTWDYVTLYKHPNLYDKLYSDTLKCSVYPTLWGLLSNVVNSFDSLKILDIACGAGLMGKFVKEQSSVEVSLLVGVDILPDALAALNRDTPDIYGHTYLANEQVTEQLEKHDFNCMMVSAAANYLELKDYKNYVRLLPKNGYVVFDLTGDAEADRRVEILKWMDENFQRCAHQLYNHRELMDGSTIQHEVFLYQIV